MTKSDQNLVEILTRHGGAVAASDWTTGSGNYVSKRAIPYGAEQFLSGMSYRPGMNMQTWDALQRAKAARPRVRKWIVITDWKRAYKLASSEEAAA